MKWFFGAVTPDGQDTVVVPPFHLKAQFSILAPGAHVTPHCGPTNERLAISVGLAGLGDAEIRVGSTWRRWRTGRATVFDDSFEHEVRNPGE
jgi:aspartyl/asparaginyl beta-hydroxylase (cupin superfamily)